jgi:hypothetical protein
VGCLREQPAILIKPAGAENDSVDAGEMLTMLIIIYDLERIDYCTKKLKKV